MVTPADWLRRHGGPVAPVTDVDVADALAQIREQYGKAARAHLAQLVGVSKGTAGRWLSGKQQPSSKVAGRVDAIKNTGKGIIEAKRQQRERQRAAEKIRKMRTIKPRMVAVESDSPGSRQADGRRQIQEEIMLGVMADRIADAYERGDEELAAELLSQAMIAGYAGEDVTDDSGLASILHVADFLSEPDVTYED